MAIRTYKDLIVWQKAVALAKDVYLATREFPKSEIYGLASQIRRCAVSIPSNIAEGYGRKATKDYIRFLSISMGSLFELETQLTISREVNFMTNSQCESLADKINEVERMLSALIGRIE